MLGVFALATFTIRIVLPPLAKRYSEAQILTAGIFVAAIAFEAVVGTDADQVAVAPGALRRTWTEGDRRYFHYATDAPVGNEYAFFSAAYAVHEERWTPPAGAGPRSEERRGLPPDHDRGVLRDSFEDGRIDGLPEEFPDVYDDPLEALEEILDRFRSEEIGDLPRFTGGAVGYLDFAGNMDTCIALRTIVWKNGVFDVQAGAGVVADSVPASEYQETMDKAKAMLDKLAGDNEALRKQMEGLSEQQRMAFFESSNYFFIKK